MDMILLQFQYSEFISKLFTAGDNIFKSFDVELKGDFSFPRHQGSMFAFSKTFPVGGFLTMNFGRIFKKNFNDEPFDIFIPIHYIFFSRKHI